ncbi:4-coumarate--CoA ligase family protein [Hibiscus syriacus]|uniref:4-coumarate--CoA ligase family protein n=1 Tax=Hibiscus syriacus TaxID=106335 RepID=A0A6A2WG25_HIBSY|nr:RHOMBOID-like protein 9, chloroplastic [Hibiscus syriacus]XP_039054470.1 RHOMBOID-like protein 9, chloroplastic [Hibiscus syriacus]KAE8654955.1 4-coumarate--CoA ligase family protein [Hibiscus syriacus]
MAVIPLRFKMPYKDQNHDCKCKRLQWHPLPITLGILTKAEVRNKNGGFNGLQWRLWTLNGVHPRPLSMKALPKESSQLRSLDSYFQKLQEYSNKGSSMELVARTGESSIKKGLLESLEAYLGKLDEDSIPKSYGETPEDKQTVLPFSVGENVRIDENAKFRSDIGFRIRDVNRVSKKSEALNCSDEASHLYLIGILASINIAVFIFEIATPVRIPELELFSIPSLYGAKINDLILVGEWWRLVTPMFLHSGILHVSLGCWGLLSFGPQVCRHYGSFTFFLIYLLGGFAGNLISFFHTPEPTVGGTGPVFAVIGAWLIYQIQNRNVMSKDNSDRMFQKAILVTALSCILSNFGPIDDWTHLGAAFSGIAYGFFICPTLQLDEISSRTAQEEQIRLVGRFGDPCKSLILFAVFVLVFSSLIFFIEPPIDTTYFVV